MNILLVSPMLDNQSGTYIHDSFIHLKQRIAFFDWRRIGEEKGLQYMNNELVNATNQLKPDLTLIVKGTGITGETVQRCREVNNKPIVGWIFDVTLAGRKIPEVPEYIDLIKELDIFYTFDEDAVPELKALGVNSKWLPQACYEPLHKEQVINSIQKRKYGADVVFLGSVGGIHPNRAAFLERIHKEGFNFKLYGDVLYPKGLDPIWVQDTHTGYAATNDMHANVCNSSKIVIGLDGWPEREKSYSLRLYKTLCAGAFYLTTHTKGIEKVFKPGVHLDTFKNEDEMIEKIIKYLNDDELRVKIAEAGKKEVLEKHQEYMRLEQILEDIKKWESKA